MADTTCTYEISGVSCAGGAAFGARIDAHGAQLMSLSLAGREYLWQGDARWWPRRAPILFPIVGSIRPGAASAAGPLAMGRHGIARDRDFTCVHADGSSVVLELASDGLTREAFPFDFRLRMTYAVEGASTLCQAFEVTNTGRVELPFTLGGHPAFNVPLCEGERFEDYELRFSRRWTASSPAMVEGGLWDFSRRVPVFADSDCLPLDHRLFDVDTLLLEGVPDSAVELLGPQGHGVRVGFEGFPYLGLWSAAGDAPFVAVEPWHGCSTALDEPDRFEAKRAMMRLAPGESKSLSFTIWVF